MTNTKIIIDLTQDSPVIIGNDFVEVFIKTSEKVIYASTTEIVVMTDVKIEELTKIETVVK